MSLVGCLGGTALAADHARVTALVHRAYLWREPQSQGSRVALGAVPDGILAPSSGPPLVGGKAVDGAGRGLVFTGRLFDAADFARAHGLAPHSSDAALVAAWLARHDPADMAPALAALDGDYALARWDPATATLLLATAPMATRTLYWHHTPQGSWFASSLALLFRFPAVPRTPSRLNVAAHLSALVLDPADTMFEQIRQLPQGTLVRIESDQAREEAIWRPDPARRLHLRRDEDYVDAARELLERAVRKRVQGPRPPAIALSGGLDSPATAATAAMMLAPTIIDTYTAVPSPHRTVKPAPGWHVEEQSLVEDTIRRHPNLRPHFCHSDGPAPFELESTPLFLAGGRAAITTAHMGWFDPLYRAIRADGHTCVLMSTDGNFTLTYDGLLTFPDLLRRGRLDLFARYFPAVMRYMGKNPVAKIKPYIGKAWPELHRLWWRCRGQAAWQPFSPVRPDAIQALDLERHMKDWAEAGIVARCTDDRQQRAHFLHKRGTRRNENTTMLRSYYGLDFMDPLGDRALVEFCLAIPSEQYFRDGRSRSLARRVLADRLPPSLINETRHGQQKPEWYDRMCAQKEALAAELEQLERVPLAASIIDLPKLRRLMAQWPKDADAATARRFDYESLLPRAIHMGRFLRWLDGGNQ